MKYKKITLIILILMILFLSFSFYGCSKKVYQITIYDNENGNETYKASKIIEYTDTYIKFIDTHDRERIITGAERIDVMELKYTD